MVLTRSWVEQGNSSEPTEPLVSLRGEFVGKARLCTGKSIAHYLDVTLRSSVFSSVRVHYMRGARSG